MDQGYIRFVNSPIAKLIRQILERGFSLSDNQQPRCISIETMNDSGSYAGAGKFLKMVGECIRERPRRCARRRMDHEPGRLVYNYQRVVFVNDIEWDIFRREDIGRRRDQFYFNFISFAEFIRRLRDFSVYEYVFILNQTL